MITPTIGEITRAIASTDNPEEALLAIWRIIEPEWDNLPKIRPGDYKLPKEITVSMWDQGLARGWGKDWKWQGLLLNIGPGTEGY